MEEKYYEPRPQKTRSTGRKAARIIGMAFMGVVFAALFALVFGFLVKWLWNGLMPDIFGLGLITYWQAFGLVILAKLLFGGFGHDFHDRHYPHPRHFHDYAENGSNRESCHGRPFEHWKHYGRFWKEEGREAFNEYMERMEKKDAKGQPNAAGQSGDDHV